MIGYNTELNHILCAKYWNDSVGFINIGRSC